jgi:hypothetical protein
VYIVDKLHSYRLFGGIIAKKFAVVETVVVLPKYTGRLLLLKMVKPFLAVFVASNWTGVKPTDTDVDVAVALGVESMFGGIDAYRAMRSSKKL